MIVLTSSSVNETDCHLTYDIYEDALTLFIPRIDPATVIWNGRGSTRAEAFDKYDVDEVHYNTSVADFVSKWPTTHGGDVYILHPNQAAIVGQYKHSRVDFQKLQIAINSARMIKDDHEIGLIRKANDITAKAHREVLLNILKFKNESQVEAIFLDACVSEGAKHQAYEVIAASGVNASTLHYIKNDEPLEGRQLMCLDAGCEWECYASDVTRSFPLSGSWPSREAKQIHDLVKTMQDCCIKRLAPGIRYLDLHILAHHIAIDGLLALGILHNGSVEEIYLAGTSRAFFPHGLGHHIGLEVHDIGQRELMSLDGDGISSVDAQTKSKYSANYHLPVYHPGLCMSPTDTQSPVLEAGMVVTVEPGIYFSLYALETLYLPSPVHSKYINRDVLARFIPVGGVRIEDDILITRFGYENLTTAPKGEEMLEIIKSQAKPDLSLPISTAATAASPYIPPPAPLPGGLPCLTSSALSVKPAPRRKLFSCNACRYCHSRMVRNLVGYYDSLEHLLTWTGEMQRSRRTQRSWPLQGVRSI
jgi:Xaa-Pro aminopeptidase